MFFDRSFLTKHCRSFSSAAKGADESVPDLLQALSRSPLLEELRIHTNPQIPAEAWQQLPDGAWPKLRVAQGIPEEDLRRLRGHGELEGQTEGDPCRHDPSEGREGSRISDDQEDTAVCGDATRTCLCVVFTFIILVQVNLI